MSLSCENTFVRCCRCWATTWWPWLQNGRELVAACSAGHPDLIIADVRMPDMDGDEAIREICRQRPTPFILISAYSKPVDSQNGFGDVAWTCLTKPIKREDLEKAIQLVCPQD